MRVAGFDPVTQPREVRARIGWMPDVFGTWDTLTCREVLDTTADAYRVPRSRAGVPVDGLLELVHLERPRRPAHPGALPRARSSGSGWPGRWCTTPHVLLLDEPASGLDPRSRIELRGIVRDLAGQGKAVLVSSHVLAELEEMADRAVLVARGRTVAVQIARDGDPAAPPVRRRSLVRALAAGSPPAGPSRTPPDGATPDRDGIESSSAATWRPPHCSVLVRAGVPVVSFHPAGGVLEQAYLALSEDRR